MVLASDPALKGRRVPLADVVYWARFSFMGLMAIAAC
jgi:hypothetical protein